MTLCEDMSDNGGFRAALKAFKKLTPEEAKPLYLPTFAGFTAEQLFTLAYANVIITTMFINFNAYSFRKQIFELLSIL